MGETGCGKTRLIRFMCDLAAQGTGKKNMQIMKARKHTYVACIDPEVTTHFELNYKCYNILLC